MDSRLLSLLTLLGLVSAVGPNRTIPLFLLGLGHYLGLLHLAAPWGVLGAPPVLAAIAGLTLVEILDEKVIELRPLLHGLELPLTLTAGAIAAGTQAQAIDAVHPGLVVLLGLVSAGGVHYAHAGMHKTLDLVTFGKARPVLSGLGDVGSALMLGIALVAPALVPVVLLLVGLCWLAAFVVLLVVGRRLIRGVWLRFAPFLPSWLAQFVTGHSPSPSIPLEDGRGPGSGGGAAGSGDGTTSRADDAPLGTRADGHPPGGASGASMPTADTLDALLG